MCGIAGIFNYRDAKPADRLTVDRMLAAIRHRGPEVAGVYLNGPVGLGHDRLSIIDLEGGLQPIPNEDGSIWVAVNGEIFNYIELRQGLLARGHTFRTGSDSEVIVHLYEEMGPECVQSFIGQYAFALWDARKRRLVLGRDRFGVRPLFYARSGGTLLFGSEIKALLAAGLAEARLDMRTLDQVFTYWSPLPGYSAFEGVAEVPPAHYLVAEEAGISLHRYWSLDFTSQAAAEGGRQSEQYYAERLFDLLVDATRLRLRADVPVGAYLSGGLDSSTIAAIVRRYTTNHLKTFSIAFQDLHFDERAHQRRMAEHLGTEHFSIECTSRDIAEVFPDVVWHTEAPLLRTAPAPMFILSQLVRQHRFKVVLTGEGSDEALGGYDIFKETQVRRFWAAGPGSRLRPLLLRKLYGDVRGMGDTSQAYLQAFFKNGLTETADPHYSHLVRWRNTARLKRLFSAQTRQALEGYSGDDPLASALDGLREDWDWLSKAQYIESRLFMSQYLLSSQGDRMAMAHAVEGRFPFLDHRLVEFAAGIPPDLRLRGFNEKYILKRAVSDLLPSGVLARVKRPYRAPIRDAFLGPDSPDYVRDLMSRSEIEKAGIFDPSAVEMLVKKCLAAPVVGEMDSMALVGVLSTQLLYNQFIERHRAMLSEGDADFSSIDVGEQQELVRSA
jgi:asparagine synthase (glutamine-hydrolysing)